MKFTYILMVAMFATIHTATAKQPETNKPESICPYMPKPMQAKCRADEKKPKLTNEQFALIKRLDEVFLKAGIRLAVGYDLQASRSSRAKNFPSLIIQGHGLDKVGVYQIESRLKAIDAARKVGFKSLVYYDFGTTGYAFELTADGTVCARDLCF